ncbi:sulfotransferase family protein [soil metagenome]
MSLKNALEELGLGPCHHMEEVMANPAQVSLWQAYAAGEPTNWDVVFDGFSAQIDWPGAHVWRELAAAYPDAKVVHSVRPEEAWWNSYSQTIGKFIATYREMPLPPHIQTMCGVAEDIIGKRTFGGNFLDRDTAIAAFRRRTEEVKAAIPAERLLVFDVAEGWEPLCAFLGKPVPTTDFPHRNKVAQFWEIFAPPA